MKKPVEAIEWLRSFAGHSHIDPRACDLLAYLDSIPEWPADLTRERLEELASEAYGSWYDRSDALRRLAAIAPKRGKRKVELWEHDDGRLEAWPLPVNPAWNRAGWRKVGEAEIDA